MPDVKRFYDREFEPLRRQGLKFVTVSNDFLVEDMTSYIADMGLRFPVYFDAVQRLNDRYDLDESLPKTIILNRRGTVVARYGKPDWHGDEFRRELERLLR